MQQKTVERTNSTHERSVILLQLDRIDDYPNHPFPVLLKDAEMDSLKQSIKEMGVMEPIFVRRKADGRFETISGHRRRAACRLLGIEEIPAIILDLTDEEAEALMIDSNLHRNNIPLSILGDICRRRVRLMNHQGKRTDLTSTEFQGKSRRENESAQKIGSVMGIGADRVRRLIRLTYLIPAFRKQVDEKDLPLCAGVELSYLTDKEQQMLDELITETAVIPTIQKAKEIRRLSFETQFYEDAVREILQREAKGRPRTIRLLYKDVISLIPRRIRDEDRIVQYILNTLRKEQNSNKRSPRKKPDKKP